MSDHLSSIVQGAVDSHAVPFAIVAVGSAKGVRTLHASGVQPDSICSVASLTKPMVSAAAMQLVESGLLHLDEPVAELKEASVLENGELRPARSTPTLRQLLSHSSGFGYEFLHQELYAYMKAGKMPSLADGGDAFLSAPLIADPGTEWNYGISTDWVGRVVERAAGMRLDEYLTRHIFEPLGMTDTFYEVPAEKQYRLAPIYKRRGKEFERIPPATPDPKGFRGGGTGLFSTAPDFLKFCQAILCGGKPILCPESIREMASNQIGKLSLHPFRSMSKGTLTDGASIPGGFDKFGLGFALSGPLLSWCGILNTVFWINLEKGEALILLTQMLPALDEGICRVADDLLHWWN